MGADCNNDPMNPNGPRDNPPPPEPKKVRAGRDPSETSNTKGHDFVDGPPLASAKTAEKGGPPLVATP